MKSFNKELKSALVAEIIKHRKQDQVIQGTYGAYSEGKFLGCAVGCAIHSLCLLNDRVYSTSDTRLYERHFGIPELLGDLQDVIHEGLEIFQTWPERFMEAIPIETDLSLVFPKFAFWFLTDKDFGIYRYAQNTPQQEAVETAAGLFYLVAVRERIPLQTWKDCAELTGTVRRIGSTEDFSSPARAVSHILSAYNSSQGLSRRFLSLALDVAEDLYTPEGYYEKCAEKLIELLKAECNE